ncbi:hypothetical protein LPC08_19860 [Roseomonas sp. OT10]|uniref:hypothetical protein n=1 Tax=Roseomonas cutis TaxID=2897332 RepID=UPI001E391518|nr:hypothetical protein [Roseomonas sp. OT10]UFN48246.1 hypothetical protein LPC08_19860 [Roseomonas sp. OT10]
MLLSLLAGPPRTRPWRAAAALALALLFLAAPALAAWLFHAGTMLGMALLAAHFGLTLRRGQEPLIARYSRFDFGHLPPECAAYARGLTAFWAVLLGLGALVQVLPLAGVAPAVPAPVLTGGMLLLCTLLFLGEHVVRSLRFPQYGRATPWRTCRAILSATAAGRA